MNIVYFSPPLQCTQYCMTVNVRCTTWRTILLANTLLGNLRIKHPGRQLWVGYDIMCKYEMHGQVSGYAHIFTT